MSNAKVICILVLCSLISLTLGFYKNMWGSAAEEKFIGHDLPSEGLMIGRLIKSKRDGILSGGALPGKALADAHNHGITDQGGKREYQVQFDIYYNELDFKTYRTYNSQIGFQGIVYGVLDGILSLNPQTHIEFLRLLNSILASAVLTGFVLWLYLEFGLFTSILVLASIVYSQWLTVFGKSLWWSLWAFYVPFMVTIYVLTRRNLGYKYALLILFIAIFVKYMFNGYEYITTTILMMLSPYVYFAVRDHWKLKRLVARIMAVGSITVIAFILSTFLLASQISTVTGSFVSGLKHIYITSVNKRTHGGVDSFPKERDASNSSIRSVISGYLNKSRVFRNSIITYKILIYIFLMFSFLAFFIIVVNRKMLVGNGAIDENKLMALTAVTWFSLLAPLSWFVIFKGHSFEHYHLNYIVWHMPFALYGFALIGLVSYNLGLLCKHSNK